MFFATGKSTICEPEVTGNRPLRVTNSINAGISSMTTSCGLFPASPMMMATSVAWPLPVSDNDPYRSTTIWLVAVNKPLLSSRSIKLFPAFIGPTVCELEGPIPILKISNALIISTPSDCRSVKWSGTTLRPSRSRGLTHYVLRWLQFPTSHLSANARPAHSSGSGRSPDVHRRTTYRIH